MARIFGITNFLSCLFLTFIVQAQSQTIDITTLGAKADGSDISQVDFVYNSQHCNIYFPFHYFVHFGKKKQTLINLPTGIVEQALLTAWGQACNATTPSTILIPAGTFALKEVNLNGPCQAPSIELQVQGTLQAPDDPNAITKDMEWFMVGNVNFLTISGKGIFDGQGTKAWARNDCTKADLCNKLANVCLIND